MESYVGNIERETIENSDYRRVVYTGAHMQLVVMSLKGGEEIPAEIHREIDQFIRIEEGQAHVTIGSKTVELSADDACIIPAGIRHRVENASKTASLKLYSIYTPAEHPPGTIHATFADASAAEHAH